MGLSNIQGARMLLFIGELLEGILSFLADVFLLRRWRANKGRPENAWSKDAADVAYLDWWLSAKLFVLALAGFVLLFYLFGFSFAVSFFVPLVAVSLYGVYRWIALIKA
ncbi:hypothetical protein ACVW0Y_002443 [Pseudomonas sp. TE3786]